MPYSFAFLGLDWSKHAKAIPYERLLLGLFAQDNEKFVAGRHTGYRLGFSRLPSGRQNQKTHPGDHQGISASFHHVPSTQWIDGDAIRAPPHFDLVFYLELNAIFLRASGGSGDRTVEAAEIGRRCQIVLVGDVGAVNGNTPGCAGR